MIDHSPRIGLLEHGVHNRESSALSVIRPHPNAFCDDVHSGQSYRLRGRNSHGWHGIVVGLVAAGIGAASSDRDRAALADHDVEFRLGSASADFVGDDVGCETLQAGAGRVLGRVANVDIGAVDGPISHGNPLVVPGVGILAERLLVERREGRFFGTHSHREQSPEA